MSAACASYGNSLFLPSPPFDRVRGCLLTIFSDIYRNAIGSSHNARLAKSPAGGWSVVSRLGTSYLSRGLNLYRRERHVLLAGEAVTLDHTGDFADADPDTLFLC